MSKTAYARQGGALPAAITSNVDAWLLAETAIPTKGTDKNLDESSRALIAAFFLLSKDGE